MLPETKVYLKRAGMSYLRAAVAAIVALVAAGVDNPSIITLTALLAGLLGPIIKALDPNDDSYGIGADVKKALESVTKTVKKK